MVHDHIELLIRQLDKISVPAVREAYLYLTHHASSLREWDCRPVRKGVVDDFRYVGATHRVEPGETLCLVTDGVTEAQNAAGELYGGRRLLQVLRRPEPAAPRALLEALASDVAAFTGTADAADDITVLVLRWRGPGSSSAGPAPRCP